jgi:hypothetical protein
MNDIQVAIVENYLDQHLIMNDKFGIDNNSPHNTYWEVFGWNLADGDIDFFIEHQMQIQFGYNPKYNDGIRDNAFADDDIRDASFAIYEWSDFEKFRKYIDRKIA